MKSFSPDLVLISAGFDAHEADPLDSSCSMTRVMNGLLKG